MANENRNNNTDEDIEEQEGAEDGQGTGGTGTSGNEGGSDGGKSGGNKGAAGNGGSDKTFTQSQVTRMMTREKNQGRNAAFKELGIDPNDAKTVGMIKAFIASQKTDEQKAAEQQAESAAATAAANQRAMIAEAKAEAMMQGVKPQYVDDIVTLATAKMTDDADLKTIIGEFKTKYPVWFGESSDDDDQNKNGGKKGGTGSTGQRGTGTSVKDAGKNKPGNDSNQGLGARLAAQRKAGGAKPSYWGKKN